MVTSPAKQFKQQSKASVAFDRAWALFNGDLPALAAAGYWCRPGIDSGANADCSDDESEAAEQEDEEDEEVEGIEADEADEMDDDGPGASEKSKAKRLEWTECLSLEYVEAVAPSFIAKGKPASTPAFHMHVIEHINRDDW